MATLEYDVLATLYDGVLDDVRLEKSLALLAECFDSPSIALLSLDLAVPTANAVAASGIFADAKALAKYAKENPVFTFKSGIVEGRVVNIDQIKAFAEMPSKDELFAKLLYLINAPATMLARVTNGVGRNLAVVVDQGVKEEKFKSA